LTPPVRTVEGRTQRKATSSSLESREGGNVAASFL